MAGENYMKFILVPKNKVCLNTDTLIHLCNISGCFPTIIIELQKSYNSFRKSLPTHIIR